MVPWLRVNIIAFFYMREMFVQFFLNFSSIVPGTPRKRTNAEHAEENSYARREFDTAANSVEESLVSISHIKNILR